MEKLRERRVIAASGLRKESVRRAAGRRGDAEVTPIARFKHASNRNQSANLAQNSDDRGTPGDAASVEQAHAEQKVLDFPRAKDDHFAHTKAVFPRVSGPKSWIEQTRANCKTDAGLIAPPILRRYGPHERIRRELSVTLL